MNKLKKEKGITLVALIITIVILLILAVVTIRTIQDSKIIPHAQNAADRYVIEQGIENGVITDVEALLDKYAQGGENPPSEDPVQPPETEKGISITPTTLTIKVGETSLPVTATLNGGLEGEISYTSLDESIATIDESGVVTGVAAGQTTITATCGSYSDNCEVIVQEVVWGEYQGMLQYIGTSKELKVTSSTFIAEELALNESQTGFNKTGTTKEINFSDIMMIYLGDLEIVDFGNKLTENNLIFGFVSGKIKELKGLEGVTTFSSDSFAFCTSLELVEFPSTLTTIESCAFQKTGLTRITIPAGVSSITSSAFDQCASLTEVTINKTKAEVEADGGIGTDWIPETVTKIIYTDQEVTR